MDEPLDWQGVAKRLEDEEKGAQSRLAEDLGMDPSQLSRTLRKRGFPKTDQALVIQAFFANRRGEGASLIKKLRRDDAPMRVPLFGYAAASQGDRFAINDGDVLDWIDLPRGMTLHGEFFVVQAIGSSMEPRVWPGERKLVQRRVPPARDQDCVIEFNDGSAVLKTYRGERDGQVFARQYNPEGEVRYPASEVKALHAIFPL